MRLQPAWVKLLVVMALTLTACTLTRRLEPALRPESRVAKEQVLEEELQLKDTEPQAQATSEAARSITPSLTSTSPLAADPTAASPGLTSTPETTPVPDQSYYIGRESTSDQAALRDVLLSLRTARLTNDQLILRVALVNTTDQPFAIAGSFDQRHAWLIDVNGNQYELLDASDNLKNISPTGGFAPGAANVGDLVFARPDSDGPYLLYFLSYEPIQFQLDTPLSSDQTSLNLVEKTYPLGVGLRTNQEALAPIELRVESLQLRRERVVFEVGFANTARQAYQLLVGPTGWDAWLLDAEGSQYRPIDVSPSLAEAIDPAEGWQPDQVHTGTITFSRPAAVEELRFIFSPYSALTLHFEEGGIFTWQVTSVTGNEPPPTPTLDPREQLIRTLDGLLAIQANALLAGNKEAYLATFSPDLHAEQEIIFDRTAQMPLTTYEAEVADTALPGGDAASLNNVEVEISYHLSGLPEDNRFVHTFRYDFSRSDQSWQVTKVGVEQNPPFWWAGDITSYETEHFLIFARPEVAGQLQALAQETETAYAALVNRGLELEPRYAAYFSASQADFQELTGQEANAIGAAAWRYNFDGEQVMVSSRAFYINGEAFTPSQDSGNDAGRQVTISHELVHLALADDTRPFTPSWLTEGIAVYFSEQNTPAARRGLLESGQLDKLSLAELTRDSSPGAHDASGLLAGYAYIFSGETINYLVQQFGEEQVLAFYRSYIGIRPDSGQVATPHFTLGSRTMDAVFADMSEEFTREAVRQFFDLSLDELDAQVKDWLKS